MKKQVCAALWTMLCGVGCGGVVHAQQQNFDAVEVHALKVRDDIYMLVGAGGNITMQIGDDGILLVDTQYAPDPPPLDPRAHVIHTFELEP